MTDFLTSLRQPKAVYYSFPLLLLIFSWAVYGNTLHKKFMIDDYTIYTESELSGQNAGRYFIPETKQSLSGEPQKAAPTYRPLTKMFWTLTFRMFGSDPVGYHIFNVFVFWLTCCALFFFIFVYTRRMFWAAAATLIFCVHPFQGIMMNNLPTILVSVEMSLMLLAMLFYKWGSDREAERSGWHALSLVVVGASFLIHETAAAFPLYLACALMYGLGYRWKRALKAVVPFLILSAAYFIFRLKFASLKSGLWDQARFFDLHLDQYFATFAKLTAWYFTQLISPSGVVMIWTTPIVHAGTWMYIAGGIAFLGILALIFRSSAAVVRWGIAWLAIGFLPVSMASLFRLSEGLCLETLWLVFPSIGFFLILGYGLDRLWEQRRSFAIISLAVLILVLSLTSHIYNRIWSDERRYSFFALEHAPAYRSGYFWLGTAFMREGDYASARKYLPLALSSKVYNRQIYNNLGLMDFEERKWESAEKNFLSAIEENPGHTLAYDYLGKIYLGRNDNDRAADVWRKAVSINPKDTAARIGLAVIEERSGHPQKALDLYRENLQAVAHDGETLLGLLRLYLSGRDTDQLMVTADELSRYSRDSNVLTVAAQMLAQNGYAPLAFKAFEKALLIDPKDKDIYLELGKLLGNLNRFDDAVRVWQQGEQLDSKDPRFEPLIRQAEAFKRKSQNNQN